MCCDAFTASTKHLVEEVDVHYYNEDEQGVSVAIGLRDYSKCASSIAATCALGYSRLRLGAQHGAD